MSVPKKLPLPTVISTRRSVLCFNMKWLYVFALTIASVNGFDWTPSIVDSKGFLPRASFGADSFGDVAYLFGGMRETNFANQQVFADLYSFRRGGDGKYVFQELAVASTGPKPSPRRGVGLAATDRYVLIVGGTNDTISNSTAAADVSWLYNVDTDTWTDVTNKGPSPRFGASVVKPYQGGTKFYVHGGAVSSQGSVTSVLNDLWEFDASISGWRQVVAGNTPIARYDAKAFMIDNVAYFYGGLDDTGTQLNTISSIMISNTGSMTWRDQAGEQNLWNPAVAQVDDSKVYIFGGSRPVNGDVCGNPPIPITVSDDTYLLEISGNDISWERALVRGGSPAFFDAQAFYFDPDFVVVGGYDYPCGASVAVPRQIFMEQEIYHIEVLFSIPGTPTETPTLLPTTAAPIAPTSQTWSNRCLITTSILVLSSILLTRG